MVSNGAFKKWCPKSENPAIMESPYFGVTAPLTDDRRKFKNRLLLRSVRSGAPELSLSNLRLTNCGPFRPTRQKPYTQQARLLCSHCASNSTWFWVFPEPLSVTFSIRLEEFCSLQQWAVLEQDCGVRYVSNQKMFASPEGWPKYHPFRKLGKHLLLYSSFPEERRRLLETMWYSERHINRLKLREALSLTKSSACHSCRTVIQRSSRCAQSVAIF
jgi:hypothetical protein